MLEELQKLSHHFLEIKNSPYRRYFIRTTKLTQRMSLIVGPRGIGKTTSLVQLLLGFTGGDRFDPRILYIQADHFLMGSTTLYEIAEQFHMLGGKWIVFDEIHKYPNWSKELKSIHDTFPNLKIYASGSSALQIYKGSHDLTRRALVYSMQGMSFREYLELEHGIELPHYELNELCAKHEIHADFVLKQLAKKERKVIPEFHRYLKVGYYPYFYELKDAAVYKITLEQNVRTSIESDLAAIYPQLTGASIYKMKQLLAFIAGSVPFAPNWNHIQTAVDIGDLRTLKTYFSHLEDAGLVKSLFKATKKFRRLEAPAKIYLENPNQLYAIAPEAPIIGTVRETFFLNMVSQKHKVGCPGDGDFLVDDRFLFEVGGKNKDFNQIRSHKNGHLACDELELGIGSKIPLWLFGFLY